MADPDDPNKDAIHFVPHRTVRPVYSDDDPRKDSDGDRVADEDELQWGTDPNNPDTDGDGVTDWEEIGANLDPLKDESATPEVSQRVVQEFLAEPYLNDAQQGDLGAARQVAGAYGTELTAAQEQAFQDAGGVPLLSLERERQLLGDERGPTDPREVARWAEAADNYRKALAGDPHAYVDMQMQLSGVRPSDHDLATFIRGGGVPVLAMERQFQLLGAGTERPQEHLDRLAGLQAQIDKALAGDRGALDSVGAALGMDRGDLTLDGLAGAAGLVKGIADPTQFTPGAAVLPGAPSPSGGTGAGGSSGVQGGGQGTSGAGGGGRPLDDGLPRGGMDDIGSDGPGSGGPSDSGSEPGVPGEGSDPGDAGGGGAADVPGGGSSGAEPDDPMGGGSRGDGGGSSLPGSIGPLNADPAPAGGSAPSSGGSTGPSHNDGVDDDVDFDATEIPAGNTASWPYITGQPVDNSGGGDASGASDAGSGAGASAGSSEGGSNNQAADSHADDNGSDNGNDNGNDNGDENPDPLADDRHVADDSGAYVDPDADPSGLGGGVVGGFFVAGGGYTDGGRDELQRIDLSGASVRHPGDISPYAHLDPDADSSGGGVGGGGVVVAGGGFTDGVRPELQLDLSGVTPVVPGLGDIAVTLDASALQFDGAAMQFDAAALELDSSTMQLDGFSAQTDGLDAPDGAGADGFGDGDGAPFP